MKDLDLRGPLPELAGPFAFPHPSCFLSFSGNGPSHVKGFPLFVLPCVLLCAACLWSRRREARGGRGDCSPEGDCRSPGQPYCVSARLVFHGVPLPAMEETGASVEGRRGMGEGGVGTQGGDRQMTTLKNPRPCPNGRSRHTMAAVFPDHPAKSSGWSSPTNPRVAFIQLGLLGFWGGVAHLSTR